MENYVIPAMPEPTAPRMDMAWISPYGDFYPVGDCQHDQVAESILHHKYGIPAAEIGYRAVDKLEKMGWLHLSFHSNLVVMQKEPTAAQIDAIWDVATSKDNPLRGDWTPKLKRFIDNPSSCVERY